MTGARGRRCAGAGVLLLLLTGTLAAGQHQGHQPAPPRSPAKPEPVVEPARVLGWEPVRCWRQSSAGAVTIGQTFTLVLTCAVFEADNVQVVPDESRLGVASIQLAPFEIVGGSHPPDVRRGTRRFFQYSYQLRIISPDAIGQDVNVPPLPISYRIHSRIGAAATLEGRDLSYVMPMMPIKVLSLVPADASDIRDASEASLGAVESWRFQSSLLKVLALTLGALAAAMAVFALAPLARRSRVVTEAERNRVPDGPILSRVAADLTELRSRSSTSGWDDDAVARALAMVRIVASAAIDRRLSQKPAGTSKGDAGRVAVKHGTLRASTVTVASAITRDDVARARTREGAEYSMRRQQQLEGLESGLGALTAALYGKHAHRDAGVLDEAVRHAAGVAGDVARERSGWARWARR